MGACRSSRSWRLDYKLARDIAVNKFGETLEHYIVACNPPPVQAEMFAIIEKEEAAAIRLQSISRAMEDRKHFMAVRKASKLLRRAARHAGADAPGEGRRGAAPRSREDPRDAEKVMASINATDNPLRRRGRAAGAADARRRRRRRAGSGSDGGALRGGPGRGHSAEEARTVEEQPAPPPVDDEDPWISSPDTRLLCGSNNQQAGSRLARPYRPVAPACTRTCASVRDGCADVDRKPGLFSEWAKGASRRPVSPVHSSMDRNVCTLTDRRACA